MGEREGQDGVEQEKVIERRLHQIRVADCTQHMCEKGSR